VYALELEIILDRNSYLRTLVDDECGCNKFLVDFSRL